MGSKNFAKLSLDLHKTFGCKKGWKNVLVL